MTGGSELPSSGLACPACRIPGAANAELAPQPSRQQGFTLPGWPFLENDELYCRCGLITAIPMLRGGTQVIQSPLDALGFDRELRLTIGKLTARSHVTEYGRPSLAQSPHPRACSLWTNSCKGIVRSGGTEGIAMMKPESTMGEVQKLLEREEAELIQALQERAGIAIEKSPDLMDETQYASERDLAIRNADREFNLLRQIRAALRRIRDGVFGSCIECEQAIRPKRLAALPWASRCVPCQDAAERGGQEHADFASDSFVNAA
jgi:DnaK suppressor protein